MREKIRTKTPRVYKTVHIHNQQIYQYYAVMTSSGVTITFTSFVHIHAHKNTNNDDDTAPLSYEDGGTIANPDDI